MSANIRSVYRTSGCYALIALFMALIAASTASARSDSIQRIPHPISPAELDDYAELLDLSIEQQHAVELRHDAYLDDQAPLRQQMIEVISDLHIRFRTFDDEGILVERLPQWISRVREFDDRFFADIKDMLTETQRDRMHRLRLRRERDMYYKLSAVADTLGENIPDLSVLVNRLELTTDEQREIRAILRSYEERLTRQLGQLLDALLRDCRNPQNARRRPVPLDQDGNPIIEEPEPVNTTQALIGRVRSLREFNLRTFHDVMEALPEAARDAMFHEFYSRAYGTAYDSSQFQILPALTDAVALPDLAERDRAALKRILDDLTRERRAMIEQSIDHVDEAIIRVAGPGSPARSNPMRKAISDMRSTVLSRDYEAFFELKERLTESQLEAIDVNRVPATRSTGQWRNIGNVSVFAHQRKAQTTSRRGSAPPLHDPLAPLPIDEQAFNAIVRILHAPSEPQQQLAELFRDHRATAEEALRRLAEDVVRAQHGVMQTRDRKQHLSRMNVARKAYDKAVTDADEALIESVRQVLDLDANDARFMRVSKYQERRRLAARVPWTIEPEANLAGRIDLVSMAARQGLLDEVTEGDAIDRLLHEYEQAMTTTLKRQREACIHHEETYVLRGENKGQAFLDIADELRNAQQRIREKRGDVVNLNESFVQRLADVLPNTAGERLLRRFEQTAYPMAFDDQNDMSSVITAALALNDLADSQRARLRDVRASYAEQYVQHQRRMINLCRSFSPDLPRGTFASEPDREKVVHKWELDMELLRQTRDRVNRAARREVRSILSPAQLERVALPFMQ